MAARKPKPSSFRRKLLLGAALVGALHSQQAIQSTKAIFMPSPGGIQRIYSDKYAPFTVVYPHGQVTPMERESPKPFEHTYVPNASKVVNDEVNNSIAKHGADPQYKEAREYVTAPFVHSTFGFESFYRPDAFYASKAYPTDAGLGQITQKALDQARGAGIVPSQVTRI